MPQLLAIVIMWMISLGFIFVCFSSISEKNSLVKLKVFHRNLIGQDDFLGYVEIPLDPSLVYERPQSKWVCWVWHCSAYFFPKSSTHLKVWLHGGSGIESVWTRLHIWIGLVIPLDFMELNVIRLFRSFPKIFKVLYN